MSKQLTFIFLGLMSLFHSLFGQDTIQKAPIHKEELVYIIPLRSEIDPRSNRIAKLGMEEAKKLDADIVIVDMNTYGGAVVDADSIRNRFLNYDKPIWVFINDNAASAGALISISCDSIYMAPGSTIGAATVVTGQGEAAPDKYQSYFRARMRETAERTGRNPRIAEAMVDQNIKIDSISEVGQVITFTTSEALKHGFCEGERKNINDILNKNGVTHYTIKTFQLSNTEKIISFVLNPMISGLLMLLIIGGIYFELQSPGIGFPILASAIALTLYLIPHYIYGLAEYWEMAFFMLGLLLIILEVAVIPGFGIAGVAGITFCFTALVISMLQNDVFNFDYVESEKVASALISLSIGIFGSIALMVFGGVGVIKSRFFKRIANTEEFTREKGFTSNFQKETLLGQQGIAYSVLRPGGKVIINNEIYDASSRGDYIEEGMKIEVIQESGTTLKVKEIQ